MNEHEKVEHLIAYLHALAQVSAKSDVKVFSEIQRTIKMIDELLNK